MPFEQSPITGLRDYPGKGKVPFDRESLDNFLNFNVAHAIYIYLTSREWISLVEHRWRNNFSLQHFVMTKYDRSMLRTELKSDFNESLSNRSGRTNRFSSTVSPPPLVGNLKTEKGRSIDKLWPSCTAGLVPRNNACKKCRPERRPGANVYWKSHIVFEAGRGGGEETMSQRNSGGTRSKSKRVLGSLFTNEQWGTGGLVYDTCVQRNFALASWI